MNRVLTHRAPWSPLFAPREQPSWHRAVIIAAGIILLIGVPRITHSAEVAVLSDGPLESALTQTADAFHRESGHTVKFGFGLSPMIHKRVIDGESADIVIIQPSFIDELVKVGRVAPGEHPIVGRVGLGLFVRADSAVPDISTPDALKRALLSADALAFNNVASGNYFATVLERLEISQMVKSKTTRASPADVTTRIVQGKGNDIGVGTISLILMDKRIKLVGPLPRELQNYLVYAAAIMTSAQSPEAGNDYIRFLTSPGIRAAFTAAGVD